MNLLLALWWWPAWFGLWDVTIRDAEIIRFPIERVKR